MHVACSGMIRAFPVFWNSNWEHGAPREHVSSSEKAWINYSEKEKKIVALFLFFGVILLFGDPARARQRT
jgi:hypothetical protein